MIRVVQAIRGVLGKFADLPHEVETEIRGLDEARRRIAELERQIKKPKNTNLPPQLDQVAIDRSVRVAVERERAAWRQKLEQGRARFRQMSAAMASAGRAFDEVKVLLDSLESECANAPDIDTAPHVSSNHPPSV
jgi:multidrug resistance efflux pump